MRGVRMPPELLGRPAGTDGRRARVVPLLPNPVLGPPPLSIPRDALLQLFAEQSQLLECPTKPRVLCRQTNHVTKLVDRRCRR
jgi:hypothetical protein